MGELDVVRLECAVRILAVNDKHPRQLLLEEEGYGEQLGEALRLDQRVVADAARRHIEDDMFAGGADLRPHLVHWEALPRGIAGGEAVMRADDERVALFVWQEDRRGVRRQKVSRRLHCGPQTVSEVERRGHLVIRVM